MCQLYGKQLIALLCESIGWFMYDEELRHCPPSNQICNPSQQLDFCVECAPS